MPRRATNPPKGTDTVARFETEKALQRLKTVSLTARKRAELTELEKVLAFLPWERQPEEEPEEYALFIAFRDTPPVERVTRGLENAVKKAPEMAGDAVIALYKRWDWKDRAAAWDGEQQRIRDEAALERARKSGDENAIIASKLRDKAVEALMASDPTALRPKDYLDMLRLASELLPPTPPEKEDKKAGTVISSTTNILSLGQEAQADARIREMALAMRDQVVISAGKPED